MSKRLKLYNVNIKYIRNLHNVDDNVPSVSPQIGKYARPFLGIIVLVPWESVLVLLWRRLNSMLLLMGKN
ncbi:MAG: type III toxin-antitoxin system ToxN/AbiQ family toxin [Oliverpabstia sp.]